ncbi:MAG: tRNA pseudouridine(55) synthase TruB [Acidobacteriota bacterium]|jgi:tRNA pseudouridine55 synthase|nr:tRNA pseudouridine(55) synthase TruB [Acidobacteriota bacterium]
MTHGLLPVAKPGGITSHDAVKRVRRVFPGHKVGHFGTLDPIAEGLLLVGIGKGTRLFQFYQSCRKVYSGVVRFGVATTTYDVEGEPVGDPREIDLNGVEIEKLLQRFRGRITQVPPIYSAKKMHGRPLYAYAREGVEVIPKPVEVDIFALSADVIDSCRLSFRAETGGGVYMRSLAHDMGQILGCGAFLESLSRDAVGEFKLADAIGVADLEKRSREEDPGRFVIPMENLLPDWPILVVGAAGKHAVLNGNPLWTRDVTRMVSAVPSPWYRVLDESGQLVALVSREDNGPRFNPRMVFA